jgi:hypothetical protein
VTMKKTSLRAGTEIGKTEVGSELLRFSFSYFNNDAQLCPRIFAEHYTQKLMERLKELSRWTLRRFTETRSSAVRNHFITWSDTARPGGFAHLPQQLRDGPAWQFGISANEYGRVHGLLVGAIFYVVWLDYHHQLYPKA